MEITHAIARCRAGDKAAYAVVVAAYADRLVSVLQKLLGNLEDARDVAQETFVRAYTNLHRYDPERPFEPWLYRMGRNLAYNHMKAAGRRARQTMKGDENNRLEVIEGDEKSPVDGLLECERRGRIDEVLSSMRPQFREILLLRYMSKLEYEEIAARMSIPMGTVKTWLNRAKEQFRKMAEGSDLF